MQLCEIMAAIGLVVFYEYFADRLLGTVRRLMWHSHYAVHRTSVDTGMTREQAEMFTRIMSVTRGGH